MTTAPARRSLTLTASAATVVEAVLVVMLRDGTLGFATMAAAVDRLVADPQVTLVDPATGRRTSGTARMVRSGTAYEEVRGRTRAASGLLGRWRHRRDDAVVLVSPEAG